MVPTAASQTATPATVSANDLDRDPSIARLKRRGHTGFTVTGRRRFDAMTWLGWVIAGALGGGLAAQLSIYWMVAFVYGPTELTTLAYLGASSAVVSALFQVPVLLVVAPRRGIALLWLPATLVAGTLLAQLLDQLVSATGATWVVVLPGTASALLFAFDVTYGFAIGVGQGLILLLATGHKRAPLIWIVANLVAVPAHAYFAHPYLGSIGSHAYFVESSAISHGAYAAVTGMALILVLRLRRRAPRHSGPKPAMDLQGQS